MAEDRVSDHERLFRRVPARRRSYVFQGGVVQFSTEAFNDRGMRPSVDRANLCGNDPKHTQKEETDGVFPLLTGEVRAINDLTYQGEQAVEYYLVDVHPDPILPQNHAHAVITTSPEFQTKSAFRRLKERLARLASGKPWNETWLIPPKETE